MKISTRDANALFARPDADKAGLLIYGTDGMRVALKRQEYLANLLGPGAEEEMRLTRIQGAELRREPALLLDAVKATGFFPGPRAVLVEDATQLNADTVAQALADWRPGDAQIVVTAGDLKPTAKLRKTFEGARTALAAAIYDTPPDRAAIDAMLRDARLDPDADAMAALLDLSRALDPGDFRQTVEKLSLYKLGDPTPVTPADVAACAPMSTEADVDDILQVVAEARTAEIGPVMARLQAQGANPVSLVIQANRHFRTLYRIAASPGAPLWGVRDRDRAQRQARAWGAEKLQTALGVLTDTDLALRSAGQTAPQLAVVERSFIRLAMLGAQR